MIKRKKKTCAGCQTEQYLFGRGLCCACYKTRQKPINKRSAKLQANLLLYTPLKNKFLRENPRCQARCSSKCQRKSSEVHHRKGREGEMLIAVEFFMAVCRNCHNEIEAMGKEVYDKGFKVLRTT